MNHSMIKLGEYLLLGIVIAVGGMFFSELCGSLFNGMNYGAAVSLGMGIYLCVVIVTCTGLILQRLDENKSSHKDQ